MKRTMHLSSEAASAPDEDTSRARPRRFARISCNFSKLVAGGGKCRLFDNQYQSDGVEIIPYRSTAVCGNASCIRVATAQFASNMNSSTRELVSRSAFCSTSTGSDDSALCRCILTSGEARFNAPAAIRFALSLIARALSKRIDSVMVSVCVLHG